MSSAAAIRWLLVAALAGLWAGCRSGSNDDSPTLTEKKRSLLGPDVGAFLVEGQRAYERGAYLIALAMTDSVEQIAPDLADLHYLRGAVYTQLNRLEVANAAYETVMELDPQYKGARFHLGLLASRMGRLRDAIDWMKAEAALESTSELQLELGRAYAKLGVPDSAKMAYLRAIDIDSTNSTAYMWLGQLYEELGEMDKALSATRAGIALRPEDLDYKYVIGSLLSRMGRVEEAEDYLRPVALQRPWHHGAQLNFGQVLMRLGREDEAKPYFAQADSAQQLQQKIIEAEEAINREPTVLQRWVELGELLREAEQYAKAIEAFKVATTLDPWNMRLQNNLALLYMENDEIEPAIRRFEAIVHIDSTLADIWLNLGVAHANAGHREEARTAWQRVVEMEPGHPVARAYLSRLSEIPDAP